MARRFRVTGHFEASTSNDPKWPWTSQTQRYPIYLLLVSLNPNFIQFPSTTSRFWVTGHCETSAQNDPKMTLNITRSTLPYTFLLMSQSPKFHPIFLYTQPFSRYKVVGIGKCTEWPQDDLEHLTVKSTLYKLSTFPEAHLLHDHPFSKYKVVKNRKNRKCTVTVDWLWNRNSQRYLIYTSKYPRGPNMGQLILLHDQPFSRHTLVENRKNRKLVEWPQNDIEHLTAKSTLHTTYLPNFWSVSLHGHPFSRCKMPKIEKKISEMHSMT